MYFTLGTIGRPNGLNGAVNIHLYNHESSLICRGREVKLSKDGEDFHTYIIESVRLQKKSLVVSLDGIFDRESASALNGHKLYVNRDELPKLEKDEFYVNDIVGFECWDNDMLLGQVVSSRDQAGTEIVLVESELEMEIPLVNDFFIAIDWEKKRLIFKDTFLLPGNKRHNKKK